MIDPNTAAVRFPLSTLAQQTAQQFADEQPTAYQARRVLHNTLAVWSVHEFLASVGIDSDITQGYLWNPCVRSCTDVADLMLSEIGRIECRPLLETETTCYIPPEAWWDRLAYVAVKIHHTCTEVSLLGFWFQAEQMKTSISTLHGMQALGAYLTQLKQHASKLAGKYVVLRNWLDPRYSDDWLDAEALLAPTTGPFVFRWRSTATFALEEKSTAQAGLARGKMIQVGSTMLPLVVQIQPIADHRVQLCVQVFAPMHFRSVPQGLLLQVLDASDKICMQTHARSQDSVLQLQFSGVLGEVFQVVIAAGLTRVVKTFVI
ncbi:MAG TPA: DUF1822 family protein [Stenomitos sp.]